MGSVGSSVFVAWPMLHDSSASANSFFLACDRSGSIEWHKPEWSCIICYLSMYKYRLFFPHSRHFKYEKKRTGTIYNTNYNCLPFRWHCYFQCRLTEHFKGIGSEPNCLVWSLACPFSLQDKRAMNVMNTMSLTEPSSMFCSYCIPTYQYLQHLESLNSSTNNMRKNTFYLSVNITKTVNRIMLSSFVLTNLTEVNQKHSMNSIQLMWEPTPVKSHLCQMISKFITFQ